MERLVNLFHQNSVLFFDILESFSDAIYISNHEGTTLWINAVSETMCNLPKGEIIGRNVRELEEKGVFKPSVIRMALEAGKNVSDVQEVAEGEKIYCNRSFSEK